jgi:hypothetical protein
MSVSTEAGTAWCQQLRFTAEQIASKGSLRNLRACIKIAVPLV